MDLKVTGKKGEKAELLKYLSKSMFHYKMKKGRLLFQKGDSGDFYYIILNGNVELVFEERKKWGEKAETDILNYFKSGFYRPLKNEEVDKDGIIAPTKKLKRKLLKNAMMMKMKAERSKKEEEEKQSNPKLTYKVQQTNLEAIHKKKLLYAGQSFGELALLDPKNCRTCGILAHEDCDFALIHKADYQRYLSKFKKVKN